MSRYTQTYCTLIQHNIILCLIFDLDINECDTGVHNCDHFCHNNVGSYTCSCETGFDLVEQRHCNGTVVSLIAIHLLLQLSCV